MSTESLLSQSSDQISSQWSTIRTADVFSTRRRKTDDTTALFEENADLKLRIQRLEEENRLLKSTRRTIPPQPAASISTEVITSAFEDLDNLIAQQSKEIARLSSDRDKLSVMCFRALSIIGDYETSITRSRTAVNRLVKMITNQTEPTESLLIELRKLGFDIPTRITLNKRVDKVQDESHLDLFEALDVDDVEDALAEIQRLHSIEENSQQAEMEMKEVVSTIVQNSTKLPRTKEIENCVARIRNWLNGSQRDVSVAQEIDFIFGILGSTKTGIDDETEKAMIRQVMELQRTVAEMKERIRTAI